MAKAIKKLLVSFWLKKVADSRPVISVAMFEENFFMIVSANLRKSEANTPWQELQTIIRVVL